MQIGPIIDDLRDWSSGRFRVVTGPPSRTERHLEYVVAAAVLSAIPVWYFYHPYAALIVCWYISVGGFAYLRLRYGDLGASTT